MFLKFLRISVELIKFIFKLPEKHLGWGDRLFIARDFKPICPQIKKNVFDVPYPERVVETDEDCLFLNIWTPQVC